MLIWEDNCLLLDLLEKRQKIVSRTVEIWRALSGMYLVQTNGDNWQVNILTSLNVDYLP